MRAQEVIVRSKKDDKRESAIVGFEAAGGTDVEFKSSVESFDKLLEDSEGFRFFVEVLQADDRVVFNGGQFLRSLLVDEVDAGGIGRISVGDKGDVLLRFCGSDGLSHGDDGG